MEEGPEPQEWVERSAEHHHHHHQEQTGHAHRSERRMRRSAVTAAILAVLAAFASLLSGHAANGAILKQIDTADKWAEFQAKSIKQQIYESNREILRALTAAGGRDAQVAEAALKKLDAEAERYRHEKEPLQHDARELQAESKHEFQQHRSYAFGIACFQVGIVLASVSIMVRQRLLWVLSLVGGAAGIVFLVHGFLLEPNQLPL